MIPLHSIFARSCQNLFSTAATAVSTPEVNDMFCYQCEQHDPDYCTTSQGVCGKDPETAGLQDLLMQQLKQIGTYAHRATEKGDQVPEDTKRFILDGIFSTLTNVNFDVNRFVQYNKVASDIEKSFADSYGPISDNPRFLDPITDHSINNLMGIADSVSVPALEKLEENETFHSLRQLETYSLKGASAYAEHARRLDALQPQVYTDIFKSLNGLLTPYQSVDDAVSRVLSLGTTNYNVIEQLSGGHETKFGTPTPNQVRWYGAGDLEVKSHNGPSILVSGHDMVDLHNLLESTKGVENLAVYTHGEMLPAFGYPLLAKYPALKGHYGSAWQLQKYEFGQFPGSILMTSNCIIEPRKKYRDRIFTTNSVGYPGVSHASSGQFGDVINKSLELYSERPSGPAKFTPEESHKYLTSGFGHKSILGVADKIIEAVKAGDITKFFVVGGCDGTEAERSYFKEIAKAAPPTSVLLTLGCGKFRLLDEVNPPDIGGIPRLLDLGQCNDAYSAIVVASELAKAFDCGINDLPLSIVLSWFEQKAVIQLVTLLSLGVQNIRIGPNPPAFVNDAVLGVLVDNFNLTLTDNDNPLGDMKAMTS